MRRRPFATALSLLVLTLTCRTFAAGPVAMTITPTGELTLTLDGRLVASGSWHLRQDTYLPGPNQVEIGVGPPVAMSARQDAPGHATALERRGSATVSYTFDLDGEDLRVAAHVVDTDPTQALRPVGFEGPPFHFNPAATVTGELHSWHYTYFPAQGIRLFHPSVASPVGCWWAADDRFAFSVFSESEFDRSILVTADYGGHDYVIPAECQLDIFTDRWVPPGGSVDLNWTVRVSADRTPAHLIARYKAIYDRRFPLPMYTPDSRGLGMFSAVDPQYVTRTNPLGFGGPACRFDTARGTAAYVRRTAWLERRAGYAGHIFWSPGGYQPPLYPPDFDIFPPSVQANIPALVKGFHDQGLRVGLCARAGDGVTRRPGEPPATYRLSAGDPEQMRVLADRFRHAIAMGFDVFYLDSIGGGGDNDVRIIRHIRDTVGPGVLLYSEYSTDMELPYAGRYCECVAPGEIFWTSANAHDELRLLCPTATWLCKSRLPQPVPPTFATLGLTPLVQDGDLGRLPMLDLDH